MSKTDGAQRHPHLASQTPDGDEPPDVRATDPIPRGSRTAIPGGRSYERSEAGGEDETPPPPSTPMPIPGGRSYDPPEPGGEDKTPPPPPTDMPIPGR